VEDQLAAKLARLSDRAAELEGELLGTRNDPNCVEANPG
jgi:hypothetical protein